VAVRILTNRKFSDGKSWEGIEYNDGWFTWVGEDRSTDIEVGFSFPVPLEFVEEKFREANRVFDIKKLPMPPKWNSGVYQ